VALAEAEVKAVPTVANKNVTGSNMPGAITYPAIEVNTTKPEIYINTTLIILLFHVAI
jgi:hypothetical protein